MADEKNLGTAQAVGDGELEVVAGGISNLEGGDGIRREDGGDGRVLLDGVVKQDGGDGRVLLDGGVKDSSPSGILPQ